MNGLLRRASILAARIASSRHGTILCYHGVESTTPIAQSSAHVSEQQFRETIDVACSAAEPVPLRELVERQRTGRSTGGLFSITFDDAYVSLAADAPQSILRGGQLPITIFIVTAASETGATFWWDRVETVQRLASTDEWTEFERTIGVPDAYRTPAAASFGPLRPLRQWVLDQHKGRWPRAAEKALAWLEARHGVTELPRAMTFDEVDVLVRRGPVDIGVHTVSHPVLPRLSDDEARGEISASFAALRERWPSTLPWLAAPFGLYDDRTSRIAREAGLEGILNLHPYTLVQTSPVHGLPRVNIMENAPAWKLGLRLSGLASRIWSPPNGGLPYPPPAGPD